VSDLVIVGAGGHGRELFATVEAINQVSPTWNVLGFVDDAPTHPERVERLGSVVLGGLDWLVGQEVSVAVGIGTSSVRRAVIERLSLSPDRTPQIVHPAATIGPDVELGPGVVIYDRCTLTTNVRIGTHSHLNVGCSVQHDSSLGDFVQLSPGVFVNGDCIIGSDVFVGTGRIVTRGCKVGDDASVGAGAVVLDDVQSGSTVVGAPARPR